jgi:hypothetical protein
VPGPPALLTKVLLALREAPGVRRPITLLSTYHENTGDDLIRFGVQQQISDALGAVPRWRHVSKSNPLSLNLPLSRWSHAPISRMAPGERAAAAALASAFREAGPLLRDKVRDAAMLVVAGTPVFYFVGERSFVEIEAEHGANWPQTIFADRVEPAATPALLALGVGSIYEGPAEALLERHPAAALFMRRFVERAALVTTRDAATDELLRAAAPASAGRIVRSICPSFWAAQRFGTAVPEPQRRVTISFALESAEWDLSAPHAAVVDARERALSRVVSYFRQRGYAISLVAHNEHDIAAPDTVARRRGLAAPLLVDARGLMDEVARSSVVVTWRVHGAVAARSVGRPALLFRTDSRWEVAADLGADVADDRTASKDDVVTALDRLCAAADREPAETMAAACALRSDAFAALRDPLAEALG